MDVLSKEDQKPLVRELLDWVEIWRVKQQVQQFDPCLGTWNSLHTWVAILGKIALRKADNMMPFAIYRSSVSDNSFNAEPSAIKPPGELSQPAYPPETSAQEIIAFHRGLCSTSDLLLHSLLLIIVNSDHLDQDGCYLPLKAPMMICHGKWIRYINSSYHKLQHEDLRST